MGEALGVSRNRVRPEVPASQRPGLGRGIAIDRFILARLEKEGIKPSPRRGEAHAAPPRGLDLTGLPPTPAEVDAFLADASADAYEKQVDRLLASPHYGER